MIEMQGKNFRCDECPICEGIEHRLKSAREGGYEPQLEYCYCDKVQHKFYAGGYCEDAFVDKPNKLKQKPRKTGLAYRRLMKKQKDARLRRMIMKESGYNPYMGYLEWDFVNGHMVYTGKYIKYPKNSKRQKYNKKLANKAVRRQKNLPAKGKGYKRCYDYANQVW